MLLRLKIRLQFTGWLQYIPTAVAGAGLLVLSAPGALISAWHALLFWTPFCMGTLLLAVAAFDVTMVKLRLRPKERIPSAPDGLDDLDLIRSRRSCRSFQDRYLTTEHRQELARAMREYTQPDRLIGTGAVRLEYFTAPLTVWPTVGAREFVVAITPHVYDRLAIIDVARSLHKVVLRATRMGVATCWIGQGADQTSVQRHLGNRFDPKRDHVLCVCAVGYRSRFKPLTVRLIERVQRRRLSVTSLFFADAGFKQALPIDAAPFSAYERCFELCQWAPSALNSQTTRCTAVTDNTGRALARLDFHTATASRHYAPVALGIWCATWEAGCEALGIKGSFRALSQSERGVGEAPSLPRYDVSWIAITPT
ncbi:nitroreductase family protein [Streptomyces kunmingensis]|uniref:Nitroreductase family protein n=1 Tax=Streptomyces kunmingensis TaxID=68225 RepID=A0ABU6C4M6_9ACTN|nr:nitroreductase family protein [Streptomyces kunmingensis]MEB3959619.1 nitroreductase family protein [Streptomyces kunmingensis]